MTPSEPSCSGVWNLGSRLLPKPCASYLKTIRSCAKPTSHESILRSCLPSLTVDIFATQVSMELCLINDSKWLTLTPLRLSGSRSRIPQRALGGRSYDRRLTSGGTIIRCPCAKRTACVYRQTRQLFLHGLSNQSSSIACSFLVVPAP